MNHLKDFVMEKLDGSIIECQLSQVCGGMMPTTGYSTSTCSSGVTDDGNQDNTD